MKTILQLFVFCTWMCSFSLGQDIHWSQFNANPLFQNPAHAGHFNGDYRFVGNYRDQWSSVTVPFQTLSLSADASLQKNRNLGYGLLFFHDQVGDGQFRTIELQGNVSYLINLSKDSTHSFRTGINLGLNHRQFNADKFYFDNQFDGVAYNPALSSNETFQTTRKSNLSIGLGTMYQFYKNKRFQFTTGVGAYNLNRPNQGFFENTIERDIRVNIFGSGIYKIGFDWDLVPGINLSFQGVYKEFVLGSSVKYTLVDKLGEYRALYAGLWYRAKDAGIISIGMDYQQWFVGVSYDVNFSSLIPASRARGGIEIAVRYILHRLKTTNKVYRICPDYI